MRGSPSRTDSAANRSGGAKPTTCASTRPCSQHTSSPLRVTRLDDCAWPAAAAHPRRPRAVTEHEPTPGRPAPAPHPAGALEPQSAVPQHAMPESAVLTGALPLATSPGAWSPFASPPSEPVPDFALDRPRDPQWYQRAVFYEVLIRGFQDENGDGTGDIRGLTSRLDYLHWLGIDCIWLLPIYDSPLRDGGYDISDFMKVLPEFGDLGDFVELMEEAHQRGIRVIADLVMNHTSEEHPWFQASRTD